MSRHGDFALGINDQIYLYNYALKRLISVETYDSVVVLDYSRLFQLYKNGRVGMLRLNPQAPNGSPVDFSFRLIEPRYDSIGAITPCVIPFSTHIYFEFRDGPHRGVVNLDGEELVRERAKRLVMSCYQDSSFVARKIRRNNSEILFDAAGRIGKYREVCDYGDIYKDCLIVKSGRKYGLFSMRERSEVVRPAYQGYDFIKNGSFVLFKKSEEEFDLYYQENSRTDGLSKVMAWSFDHKIIGYKKCGYRNTTGEGAMVLYFANGKAGLITYFGLPRFEIEPDYKDISAVGNRKYIVETIDNQFAVYDAADNQVASNYYLEITTLIPPKDWSVSYYAVKGLNGLYGYISTSGKEMISPAFEEVGAFITETIDGQEISLARVKKDGRYFKIDNLGNEVAE
ncbi:MAG: WG repeat-containing protein [Bacteroidota bacterium]